MEAFRDKGTAAHATLRMRLAARPEATGRPDEVLDALGLDPLTHVPHRMRLIQEEQTFEAEDGN